jgi:uncharacterized protein (TIGR03085 family)
MPSHSAAERQALADALIQAGPKHTTLCDGWTTTELAAHLVIREGRPDAALGVLVPPLTGWTDRVMAQYAHKDYAELVSTFRSGPPRLSVFSLPGVDSRVNLAEHFVHCEDVRRALPGWEARDLAPAVQRALWSGIAMTGRMLLRRSPVSVTLATPGGERKKVISKQDKKDEGVTVVGQPGEITLYAFGRKDHADVQLEGPDPAVEAFRALTLKF